MNNTKREEKDLRGVQACIINYLSGKAKNFTTDCVIEVLGMKHKDFGILYVQGTFGCEFDPREHFGLLDCIDVDKFAIGTFDDMYLIAPL